MRNRHHHAISAFLGLFACAAAAMALPSTAVGQTVPRGYEIVDITRDNGRYEFSPRINSNGQVVYTSWDVASWEDAEIWMYDSATGVHAQITDDNVRDIFPDIAEDGTIVWVRYIGPDVGEGRTPEIMMRTPDGVITRITDNAVFDGPGFVNSAQQAVWVQYGPPLCRGLESMDLFLCDGSEVTRITASGEIYGWTNQAPEINDLGEIVWVEADFCDPPPPLTATSRILRYFNGRTEVIPSGNTAQAPDLNNMGQFVWDEYNLLTGRYEIYLWADGNSIQVTDDGINASINDHGRIVFTRNVSRPTGDVFLWEAGVFTRLTDDDMEELIPKINDRGELVWAVGPYPGFPHMDVRMMRRFATGDLNCDGRIDAFDIEAFVLALADRERYELAHPSCDPQLADLNADGAVDAFDIEPFIGALFP